METPQKSNLTTDQSSALVRFIIYHAVHRKIVKMILVLLILIFYRVFVVIYKTLSEKKINEQQGHSDLDSRPRL